jgi:hypothetical protein
VSSNPLNPLIPKTPSPHPLQPTQFNQSFEIQGAMHSPIPIEIEAQNGDSTTTQPGMAISLSQS